MEIDDISDMEIDVYRIRDEDRDTDRWNIRLVSCPKFTEANLSKGGV